MAAPSKRPVYDDDAAALLEPAVLDGMDFADEDVTASVAWDLRWHRLHSMRGPLVEAIAFGTDGVGPWTDRGVPVLGEMPQLSIYGQYALAKRMEAARILRWRGVLDSSPGLGWLVEHGERALRAPKDLSKFIAVYKYNDLARQLRVSGVAMVRSVLRQFIDHARTLLRVRSNLARRHGHGDLIGIHLSDDDRRRLREAEDLVHIRGRQLFLTAVADSSVVAHCLAVFRWLRDVENVLHRRAVAAGCPSDEFWVLWRGREAMAGWAAYARDRGSEPFRRWLSDPRTFAAIDSQLADVRRACVAHGDGFEGLMAACGSVRVGSDELVRARNEFIASNVRLAWAHASQAARAKDWLNPDESRAFAEDQLMHAINQFNWRLGKRFGTYAEFKFRNGVQGARRAQDMIRTPAVVRTYYVKVHAAVHALRGRGVYEPSLADILAYLREASERTGTKLVLTEAQVQAVLEWEGQPVSLNRPVGADGDGDEAELIDLVADRSAPDVRHEAMAADRRDHWERVLTHLPSDQERVLRLRYGFVVGPGAGRGVQGAELSAAEVGQIIRRPTKAVQKLEREAYETLRGGLLEDLFGSMADAQDALAL